jgi:hypothetical protein
LPTGDFEHHFDIAVSRILLESHLCCWKLLGLIGRLRGS